jgi:hypothetical protein
LLFFCPGRDSNEEERICFVSADEEVLPWLQGDEDYAARLFKI